MDLVFVVDRSVNVKAVDIANMVTFMKSIANEMNIAPGMSRWVHYTGTEPLLTKSLQQLVWRG